MKRTGARLETQAARGLALALLATLAACSAEPPSGILVRDVRIVDVERGEAPE